MLFFQGVLCPSGYGTEATAILRFARILPQDRTWQDIEIGTSFSLPSFPYVRFRIRCDKNTDKAKYERSEIAENNKA